MSESILTGKAKLVMVDDIDTDNIFHASLLTIHDPEEIKPHIFGNLEGFNSFGSENHEGQILFVGKNFGKGSTRQQAVTGFLAHKITTIIGESFGPIYYSNAVNAGLLLVEVNLNRFMVDDDDEIEIDLDQSVIKNISKNHSIQCKPIPKPAIDIMRAGGLMELGRTL
ncbi:MAG: 3-isopropylmalate dehydratase [Candidatus Heimdallarchaeota archaeon]|nr:3-isopropylmalate dehydratase [Candidatus Heimdallarchaeota archaeon]